MNGKEIIENGMEIMLSLCKAIQQAGGSLEMIDIQKMSAWDLISLLSTNDIRFIHKSEVGIKMNQKEIDENLQEEVETLKSKKQSIVPKGSPLYEIWDNEEEVYMEYKE